MSQRIVIHPVTRIEGHAKVSINVNDAGEVTSAQFHVTEFRGFERLAHGRPFHEMPGLMSRVCGICPISHILASAKAGDRLLGIEPPAGAVRLRRLITYAQFLQSHALSFFHLSSPDLLLGMDAPPAQRNILGLAAMDPDFARRGIRLRQYGQTIIERVTGKRIHPAWGSPGGVRHSLTEQGRVEMLEGLEEAMESTTIALERLKGLLDSFQDEIANFGDFPSLFLGTVTEDGGLEFYDGRIRISDSEGNIVADQLDPLRYHTFLSETSEEWSFMKVPYYRPMGYPAGMYRVGPLARLNVAEFAGTPVADRELREFKHRSQGAVNETFHFHLARVIEMLYCVERIGELLEDPGIVSKDIQARALLNRREGIGSCEAPRGTLFHHYEVDESGLITKANLLIATSQNNLAINKAVEQAAVRFVKPDKLEEGMLNRVEAAVRCFDPCLSCSTHALGQMPMVIELRGPDGTVRDRIARV